MFLPFSWPFLAFLILLIVYVVDDTSPLHYSRTLRRFYWAVLSALVAWMALTTLQQIDLDHAEGLWLIVLVVILASLAEDELQKQRHLRPFTSPSIGTVHGTPEAEGKAEYLTSVIDTINEWQGSTIGLAKLFSLARGKLQRHRHGIREVLSSSNADDLNYILLHVNCAALLEVADAAIMPLLVSKPRLRQLSTLSKAALLDALQKVGMRHRRSRQLWARDLVCCTTSGNLSRLKGLLDDGGDYHTTFKLVFIDLQDPVQTQVKRHIQAEGQRTLEAFQAQYPYAPAGVSMKVISDIDDTLMCSGARWPAGRDNRYPRHCVYPGVLALYNELDISHMQRLQACRKAAEEHMRQTKAALTQAGEELARQLSSQAHRRERHGPDPTGEAATDSDDDRSAPGRPLKRQRSLLNITKGLLRTTASEIASIASAPVRAGSSTLFGSRANNDSAVPEAPSPRTISFGVRNNLSRPLEGGLPASEDAPPQSKEEAQKQLDKRKGRRQRPPSHANHLVFLSARPESYRGWSEELSLRGIFEPLVRRGDMPGPPVLLMGSLRSGPEALLDYSRGTRPPRDSPRGLDSLLYGRLAKRKLKRFKEYASLYPECCWIFIGDNGQGDVLVAEGLEQATRGPDNQPRLLASFIHRVVPVLGTVSHLRCARGNKAAWLAAWRDRGIYLLKTHVGMAVQAYTLGLMDEEGLQQVAVEAMTALRRARTRYAFEKQIDWAQIIRQLNQDLRSANAILPDHMQISPIAIPDPVAISQTLSRSTELDVQ